MIASSLLLTIFCALLAIAVIGVGGFIVLLKLGVIVREAGRPTHRDYGNYSLEQGREVRPEEEQPRRETPQR
jgi:hypothetical protein